VPLVVGLAKLREDPRAAISQAQLAPAEYAEVGQIRCATVQRALFDEMRTSPDTRGAIVALEKVTAARMISVSLMSAYVAKRSGWTGVEQVRDALALGSNHSRSPQETRMCMAWRLDAGLPPPLRNVPVFSLSGRLLGYPDLLDVELGVVGEYDGAEHKDGERHRKDVARELDFRNHGLEYFTVVGGDLGNRDKTVRRMHDACARARSSRRTPQWTLTPPSWWLPEEDLDDYLVRIGLAPDLVRC
jgi:hypothetical protein